MPFTVAELENIANSVIDFRANKGKTVDQTAQDKPLLRDLRAGQESFPGGKDYVSIGVSGDVTSRLEGIVHDDSLTFRNPTGNKLAVYPWKILHIGIMFTLHELLKEGVSVVDTTTGKSTAEHSERELVMFTNLLKRKLDDLDRGYDEDFNRMLWKDGTQSAKELPGLRSFILDNPTSATVVAGIDQSSVTWWRNYCKLSINASTPANYNISKALQLGLREQGRRAQGRAKLKYYCGGDFLSAYEDEMRAAGQLTVNGWTGGDNDMAIGPAKFKRIPLEWDPTLDELGLGKYLFVLDMNAIKLRPIEGEDKKDHNPARPENKLVVYRSRTWAGALTAEKRNTSGVYSIQ